jgi:hypothetical protein
MTGKGVWGMSIRNDIDCGDKLVFKVVTSKANGVCRHGTLLLPVPDQKFNI